MWPDKAGMDWPDKDRRSAAGRALAGETRPGTKRELRSDAAGERRNGVTWITLARHGES